MKNLRGALHGIRFQDRAGATPAPARFRREKARELALGPKDRPSRQMEIAAYPNLPRSDLTPECAGRTTSPRSPVPFIGIVAHINGRPIGAAAPPAPAPSHHSSSAQRSAGLICRPRLNRDPRDLAGLAESEKFPQILEGTRAHLMRPRRFCTRPALVHGAEMAESRGRTNGCVARAARDRRAGIARRPF